MEGKRAFLIMSLNLVGKKKKKKLFQILKNSMSAETFTRHLFQEFLFFFNRQGKERGQCEKARKGPGSHALGENQDSEWQWPC